MPDSKLIVPTEIKICATCTYWDGVRTVDEDLRVVVVCESCEGECLVHEAPMRALRAVSQDTDCLWDGLHVDESPSVEESPVNWSRAHRTGS